MAQSLDAGFADIVAAAYACLTCVTGAIDVDEDRAILAVEGSFDQLRIVIKEVVTPALRRYAYYILDGSHVLIGLDNYPDRTALRLMYGDRFTAHLDDLIPHRHGPGKMTTELTDGWSARRFLDELRPQIAWAQQLLRPFQINNYPN